MTSVIPCGECESCKTMPDRAGLCDNIGCYGLMADDEKHLNGWFADYLLLREGSTFFKVNEFDVNTRIMIEPLSVGGSGGRKRRRVRGLSLLILLALLMVRVRSVLQYLQY